MTSSLTYGAFNLSWVLDWKHGGEIFNFDYHYLLVYGTPLVTEDRNKTEVFPGYYSKAQAS